MCTHTHTHIQDKAAEKKQRERERVKKIEALFSGFIWAMDEIFYSFSCISRVFVCKICTFDFIEWNDAFDSAILYKTAMELYTVHLDLLVLPPSVPFYLTLNKPPQK